MKITVTCDDFGESKEVNRRVVAAFRKRLIDRASLMVNAPGTTQALALARQYRIPIGLHFRLGDSVWQAMANSFSRRHIEDELTQQLKAIQPSHPRHFDSHLHVHLLPWVATVVDRRVKLPVRGGSAAIGPAKGSIIGLFARQFLTFDYLVDLDWFRKLTPEVIRSNFEEIPSESSVEVIVHPQKGKSLEWLHEYGSLRRHSRL